MRQISFVVRTGITGVPDVSEGVRGGGVRLRGDLDLGGVFKTAATTCAGGLKRPSRVASRCLRIPSHLAAL